MEMTKGMEIVVASLYVRRWCGGTVDEGRLGYLMSPGASW